MKIQITLSLLLAAALVGGCKSSTVVENSDLGTLRGKVALSDGDCNPISNGSGTAVSIEGTGFSTTTDATGQWEIDHVPAGIYNIIIAKSGFDTDLVTQYQFSGAGTQFLENEGIHAMLSDSVFISSMILTEKDSIFVYKETTFDSITHRDSTISVVDTVGHEYDLAITLSMGGPDSAIYKLFTNNNYGYVHDLTNPQAASYNSYSHFSANIPISRNMTISGQLGFISPTHQQGEPPIQRGDTVVLIVSYTNACGESTYATRAFLIP